MENLNSFLNPKRKENLKFVLSDAFKDENGEPIVWELRQLTAKEDLELQADIKTRDYCNIMLHYVAKSLVYPNLHDSELLAGLTKKAGKPILKATDALQEIVSSSELAILMERYSSHNDLTADFAEKVEEAKN